MSRESVHICATVTRSRNLLRIDGFRAASPVVGSVQTMNRPRISRLECGPEGFCLVCMRYALEVLSDLGIGAFAIERRS